MEVQPRKSKPLRFLLFISFASLSEIMNETCSKIPPAETYRLPVYLWLGKHGGKYSMKLKLMFFA